MFNEFVHKLISKLMIPGTVLIIVGLLFSYFSLTTPPYTRTSETLLSDSVKTTLNTFFTLYHNDIYESREVRAETGKTYYVNLVEQICSFMTIQANKGNITGNYFITMYIRHPDGWDKVFLRKNFQAINGSTESVCFDLREVMNYVEYLSNQAGIKTYLFDIYIEGIGEVNYSYQPLGVSEKIKLNNTMLIKIDRLKNMLFVTGDPSRTKSINKISERVIENKVLSFKVGTARVLSVIVTIVGAILFIVSVVKREFSRGVVNKLDDFERKHKNIIISAEKLLIDERKTVFLRKEEDLLRTSRILGKPIIKTVLDDRVIYAVSDGEFLYVLDSRVLTQ